ncbi:unnamed protein product [Caenorhabditis auriculariae]|uniref:CDK5RAP3-like protein n=1 Tax=Caenorhabditis auriculariae TaxID=2777116 RepID=A0A8S1HMC8_9PELO|nr:unnamed protein product [Caenorhabditis auriculariae]
MAANDLPIDIHSSKLLDWLVSRRHCNRDWQKNVVTIREKIKHAILDMPESKEIVQLLQGSYINYFHCVRIIEILRDTEKDTKNFLGYYSSQRMKDWQEIESLYKKDNVYLAEGAQVLQRLVQYEIPGLKKQITKSDQAVTESEKKFKDYGKQSEDSKKVYEKELQRMSLQGKSLRAELLSLAADLPQFFEKIASEVQNLSLARQHYGHFRDYMHQGKASSIVILPVLALIMERGVDVTAYEWKYGKKPDRVEKPNFDLLLKADEKKEEDEIDFGDDEIDFGGDSADVEIDFGEEVQIDVVADDTGAVGESVASGEDALSLLENSASQKVVRDELTELLAFLTMRLDDETRQTGADLLIRGAETRPDSIAKISTEQLKDWISLGNGIVSQLNNPQKNHLFKIRSSPQFVESVVEDLEKKRNMEGRYKRMQELMVEKQKEARETLAKSNEELKRVVESTRQLQKQMESEISKKYSGRPVNLMGGINQALANV